METLTDEFCFQNGYQIVSFPLNIHLKLLGCILSLLSIIPLIYVQHQFIYPTTFHCNIKIILIAYFSNATFHALILTIFLAYQNILVSDMIHVCDIFLSRNLYIIGHILNIYALLVQFSLQMAACVERTIATIHSQTYEQRNSKIGFLLTFLSVVIPAPLITLCYWDETFEEPQISVITTPRASTNRINLSFLILTICAILCLLSLQYIAVINRRRKSCSRFQLSRHFQIKENLDTTRFITVIMLLQISIITIFAVSTLTLRLMQNMFKTNVPLYHTLKSSVFILPVFFFVLPFLTIYMLTRRRRKSQVHCANLIGLTSKGEKGVENYNNIIYSKW